MILAILSMVTAANVSFVLIRIGEKILKEMED